MNTLNNQKIERKEGKKDLKGAFFLILYFGICFHVSPPNSGSIDRGLEGGGTRWNFWRQIVGRSQPDFYIL